jgi:DNA polymerase I-like protein with 3'-5' exonuclease and polymerase domains
MGGGFFSPLKTIMKISLDTETTGLDWLLDTPFLITSYSSEGEGSHIHFDPEKERELKTAEEFLLERYAVCPDPVFHNFKYDAHMLLNVGLPLPPDFNDSALMSFIVNEYESVAMESLARKLGFDKYEDKEFEEWRRLNKKEIKKTGYLHAPIGPLIGYGINDAKITLVLGHYFKGALEKLKLWPSYEYEKEFTWFLIKLERQGIKVNVPYVFKQIGFLEGREIELRHELKKRYSLANPNSPAQVKECLLSQNIRVISTNAVTLKRLGTEFTDKILEFRKVAKLRPKLMALLRSTIADTQRCHVTFNQTVAKTTRLSSSGRDKQRGLAYNLQNIDRVEED